MKCNRQGPAKRAPDRQEPACPGRLGRGLRDLDYKADATNDFADVTGRVPPTAAFATVQVDAAIHALSIAIEPWPHVSPMPSTGRRARRGAARQAVLPLPCGSSTGVTFLGVHGSYR